MFNVCAVLKLTTDLIIRMLTNGTPFCLTSCCGFIQTVVVYSVQWALLKENRTPIQLYMLFNHLAVLRRFKKKRFSY